MDKIRIDDIKIYAYHGVLPEGRRRMVRVFVSAELSLDLKSSGTSDRLDHTVNYADVTKLIEDTFTEVSFNTIEAAAESVIESILTEYNLIQKVTIKVSKPNAPIDADFRDVSVELSRSRHTVYLGLGSNLGDKRGFLNKAVEELGKDTAITVRKGV